MQDVDGVKETTNVECDIIILSLAFTIEWSVHCCCWRTSVNSGKGSRRKMKLPALGEMKTDRLPAPRHSLLLWRDVRKILFHGMKCDVWRSWGVGISPSSVFQVIRRVWSYTAIENVHLLLLFFIVLELVFQEKESLLLIKFISSHQIRFFSNFGTKVVHMYVLLLVHSDLTITAFCNFYT